MKKSQRTGKGMVLMFTTEVFETALGSSVDFSASQMAEENAWAMSVVLAVGRHRGSAVD